MILSFENKIKFSEAEMGIKIICITHKKLKQINLNSECIYFVKSNFRSHLSCLTEKERF